MYGVGYGRWIQKMLTAEKIAELEPGIFTTPHEGDQDLDLAFRISERFALKEIPQRVDLRVWEVKSEDWEKGTRLFDGSLLPVDSLPVASPTFLPLVEREVKIMIWLRGVGVLPWQGRWIGKGGVTLWVPILKPLIVGLP